MANTPKPIRRRYIKRGRYEVSCFGLAKWFPAGKAAKSTSTRRRTWANVAKLAEQLFREGANEVVVRDMKQKRQPTGWMFYSFKKPLTK